MGRSRSRGSITAFQQKTHDALNIFHLIGISGGLFLNKLIKYVQSEDTFAHLFRLMIRVPKETQDVQRQMQAFVRFLRRVDCFAPDYPRATPACASAFFLSAWWHIQDPERGPVFYLHVRGVLMTEEVHSIGSQGPVEDYFAFRNRLVSRTSTWPLFMGA